MRRFFCFSTSLALLGLIQLPISAQVSSRTPATAQAEAVDDAAAATSEEDKKKARRGMQLVPVTKKFLATLDEKLTAQAKLEFDSEKRVGWHFIPMDSRKGAALKDMTAEQKEAAMKVLQAAVSKLGFTKSTAIMQLEKVLRKLEGEGGRNERNPEKYYFTVFGTPAQKQHWGLSIEGHHLSLNFTMQGNKIVDSTPQFFATNPAKLTEDFGEGFPKGLQVLGAEEQLGFKLVKSLSEEQLAKAMLPGETPSEIRAAGSPQPPTDAARGIAASELDDAQKEALKKLMTAYTAKMKPLVAKGRWELIEEAGFDKVQFAWSGAKRAGRGHYYVVQGPTFLIEFINVQADAAGNPANHVHCVWRDMQGDFDLPVK